MHSCGRPGRSSWLLASDWISSYHCGHLGSEPADWRSFSLMSFSVNLLFYKNKYLKKTLHLYIYWRIIYKISMKNQPKHFHQQINGWRKCDIYVMEYYYWGIKKWNPDISNKIRGIWMTRATPRNTNIICFFLSFLSTYRVWNYIWMLCHLVFSCRCCLTEYAMYMTVYSSFPTLGSCHQSLCLWY